MRSVFVKDILTNLCKILPDEWYIKMLFKRQMGYIPDLDNPKTFNEKLQWLKLNDRNPKYTEMVDKYAAKEYVKELIGDEYIIPTLGVWDRFEDINFQSLPQQFVLKCTHDSGGLVMCKDKNKLNLKTIRKKINSCLKRNYYWSGREWPYKNVEPRVIAEQFMLDSKSLDLRDYKFFCFNGKVRCYKIDFDRFVDHHANYYDLNGNILEFGEKVCPPVFNRRIEVPKCIKKMIELAEILSENITFLRVDFYEVDGKIYFGELTFYPDSGFGRLTDNKWDEKLGLWLEIC